MEGNKSHIDQSLNKLLSNLESKVPEINRFRIENFLEHYDNPIDLGLYSKLGDIEKPVPKGFQSAILESDRIGTHVIDQALKNTLEQLTSETEVPIEQIVKEKNKKRKILPILLLIGLMILGAYIFKYNQREKVQNESGNEKIKADIDKETKPNPSPFLIQKEKNDEKRSANKIIQDAEKGTGLAPSYIEDNNSLFNSILDFISGYTESEYQFEAESDNIFSKSGLRIFRKYPYKYETENTTSGLYEIKKPRLVRSPFQFGIWTGLYLEDRTKVSADPKYSHNDAIKLMNMGNSKIKTGRSVQFDIRYNISRRFSVSTGIQYSSAEATTKFEYTYSDIPVFDSTGALKGYIYRSPQSSPKFNTTVKSSSKNITVPINMNFQLLRGIKWQFCLGIGANMQLENNGKYSTLDFEKSKLVVHQFKNGSKISPNAQMSFNYTINNWFILGIEYRLSYRTLSVAETEKHYKGREMCNSLQIGLIFQPLIRKK